MQTQATPWKNRAKGRELARNGLQDDFLSRRDLEITETTICIRHARKEEREWPIYANSTGDVSEKFLRLLTPYNKLRETELHARATLLFTKQSSVLNLATRTRIFMQNNNFLNRNFFF